MPDRDPAPLDQQIAAELLAWGLEEDPTSGADLPERITKLVRNAIRAAPLEDQYGYMAARFKTDLLFHLGWTVLDA